MRRKIVRILSFTDQAEGAWPNGTRVMKLLTTEAAESHSPGALATIIGSVAAGKLLPEWPDIKYMYCCIWDDAPGVPQICADFKLRRVEIGKPS